MKIIIMFMVLAFVLVGCSTGESAANTNVIEEAVQSSSYSSVSTGSTSSSYSSVSTGSTSSGDVLIELAPVYDTGKLIVSVSVNTHSVDLTKFDLNEITTLEFEGQVYKPSSASMLSGHHSNGKMIFDLSKKPDIFRITIKGIPNVQERVFEWK